MTVVIHGLEGLHAKFKALPEKLARKEARAATRKAANIIRDAARQLAARIDDPTTPSSVPKNIVTQESGRAGRREGGIVMKVGVRGGARFNAKSEYPTHWRFVEFGFKHKGGQTVPARPFMRAAMIFSISAVFEKLAVELKAGLDRATASL